MDAAVMWFAFGLALLVALVVACRREWAIQQADRLFMRRLEELTPLTITLSANTTRFAVAMKQMAEAMPTAEQVVENIRLSFEAHRRWLNDLFVGELDIVPLDHSKCWRCQEADVPREDDLGLCTHCAGYLQRL